MCMTMDALPFPHSKMGIHLTSLIQNSSQKTHSTHPIMIPGQRRRSKAIYSNSHGWPMHGRPCNCFNVVDLLWCGFQAETKHACQLVNISWKQWRSRRIFWIYGTCVWSTATFAHAGGNDEKEDGILAYYSRRRSKKISRGTILDSWQWGSMIMIGSTTLNYHSLTNERKWKIKWKKEKERTYQFENIYVDYH